MLRSVSIFAFFSALVMVPYCCFALETDGSSIRFGAQLISFFNLVLFIMSLVSMKQFFWPGDNNRMPFHIVNIVAVILFYSIGLPFLILNRQYYEGYASLTPFSVVGKFFFTLDISSFAQWLIVASVFVNVLYIKRYRKTFFESGIPEVDNHNQAVQLPAADTEDNTAG